MSIATAPVPIPRNSPVVESLTCWGRNRATRIFPAWAMSAILASVAIARIGSSARAHAKTAAPIAPALFRFMLYSFCSKVADRTDNHPRGGFFFGKTEKKAPSVPGLQGLQEETPLEGFPGSSTIPQTVSSAIKKGLRRAAIAFSYRRYVAAYPPSRVHRAVPSDQDRQPALRQRVAARDQA